MTCQSEAILIKVDNVKIILPLVKMSVCFSLLRSAIMCVRGHHSSIHRPVVSNIDLSFTEGKLNIESN